MVYGITVSPVKNQQLLMCEMLKAWIKKVEMEMDGDARDKFPGTGKEKLGKGTREWSQ
jgi:hypothetical protein